MEHGTKQIKKLVLQNIIFKDEIGAGRDLFYRLEGNGRFYDDILYLDKGALVKTDTYMNLFDSSLWNRCTGIDEIFIEFWAEGNGIIRLYSGLDKAAQLITESVIDNEKFAKEKIKIGIENLNEIYLEFKAKTNFQIKQIKFYTEKIEAIKPVHLSVVICTYKREKELKKILSTLKESLFFDSSSYLKGKLSIRICDNASELEEVKEGLIKVYRNRNTGGSGGFSYGIAKTIEDKNEYGISHVVLMDDDVSVINETFYRLFSFLSMIKEEYHQEVIAGRMFRKDKKNIQYTAAEVWNGGVIKHIGHNLDMCSIENLSDVNKGGGEYSGWWLSCFPIDFAEHNYPLPFFLHCDDAEYGLRHGGSPIVVNGIQVWHETYEYRQSALIAYYDMRNTLIVNTIYGEFKTQREVLLYWKNIVNQYHCEEKEEYKYAVISALKDYLKGKNYFLNEISIKNLKVETVNLSKYINKVYWRVTVCLFFLYGKRAFKSYMKLKNIKDINFYKEREKI